MPNLNPPAVSQARQPRGLVRVTGRNADGSLMPPVTMKGWINWEVNNNTFYEADTFRVCFALSLLPVDRSEMWWSTQTEIYIEIFAGFPVNPDQYGPNELSSLIYGRVDELVFDPIARKLEVSGRDLTAAFIDAKTTETFQNLTASAVATQLALRHGLTPKVTSTTVKVGKYYELDKNIINHQRSEWDMLTGLANQEQFVVYVKGQELHFEPAPDVTADPYVLKWEAPTGDNGAYKFNGKTMHFRRALNLARGVVVIVQSKNQRGQAIKVTFPAKAAGIKPGQGKAQAQVYTRTYAQMTYEEALRKAQAIHRDISQHEVKLDATLPADNILGVKNIVKVIGTGTSFDQIYYPDSITRSMSIGEGYSMTINAKNHSPESVVAL